MFRVIILIFLFIFSLNAENNVSLKGEKTVKKELTSDEKNDEKIVKAAISAQVNKLSKELANIDEELKRNIWAKNYANYISYKKTIQDIEKYNQKLKHLKYLLRSSKVSKEKKKKYKEEKEQTEKKLKTLNNQKELLSDFKTSPFQEVIKPKNLPKEPKVTNPLMIFNAFSYIKQIRNKKTIYEHKLETLKNTIDRLYHKRVILTKIYALTKNKNILKQIEEVEHELNDFKTAYDIAKTTYKIYTKKIEDIILKVSLQIEEQIKRTINVALFIFAVIIISLILKLLAKRYIEDNQRFYMTNKMINFTNFTLITLILLFSFIEDVSYLVTVIGFASAGLAIAMKDLFMSILGWFVIILGGSFRVGDRVKVKKNGLVYVGDIIDISLLRITILEDITLTSYMVNRRTGRVIFIPNNYIFTDLLANYSHEKLKTVWDGIDIAITFDSNHKKAVYIVKNIVKKYSKGYTEIARKQLNKLRNQYSLKNTNVEPRVYTFIEPYGIVISSWYMTNSFATLTIRSSISAEIIDALLKEDDITIAYPTQTINIKKADSNLLTERDEKDIL